MVYNYDIILYGDNFFPQNILKKIQGNFIVYNKYHCPTDKRILSNGLVSDEVYEYGSMIISHPLQWATENHIIEYEKNFVEFIAQNHKPFMENGVNDIRIFMEIFYEGQCNFEIFNNKLLKGLAKYAVSLPISIYSLPKRKINKWEKEINEKWQKDR